MKVIPPLAITGAILTSSDIAEPDAGEVAWSGAAVAYALGDLRIRTTTHKVYECRVAHTSAASPTPEDDPRWLEVGHTNKWAMFDLLRNTASVRPSTLTVVLTPAERVNSLALLGLVANTVTVTATSSGTPVFSYTENLDAREVFDWYDYFFLPFGTRPSVVLHTIPSYINIVITVTLTANSGSVECGACVLGTYVDIGEVQAEAESDVLNFSTVERDFAGGVSTMVQRRNVPKTVQQIWLPKERVNRARALRDQLGGTPAVWVGLPNSNERYFESVLILGFYRRFSINLRHADYAVLSLDLEEI